MNTSARRRPAATLTGLATAIAIVLLAGCTPGTASDSPDEVASAAHTTTESNEAEAPTDDAFGAVWDQARDDGRLGDGVDGAAEIPDDFPTDIPLPADGEVAWSAIGDRVWDIVVETDDPDQVERILDTIGATITPADTYPNDEGGTIWTFVDSRYAVQIQMQPGPMPPPMIGYVVIER